VRSFREHLAESDGRGHRSFPRTIGNIPCQLTISEFANGGRIDLYARLIVTGTDVHSDIDHALAAVRAAWKSSDRDGRFVTDSEFNLSASTRSSPDKRDDRWRKWVSAVEAEVLRRMLARSRAAG
jgi:hypothetical protein